MKESTGPSPTKKPTHQHDTFGSALVSALGGIEGWQDEFKRTLRTFSQRQNFEKAHRVAQCFHDVLREQMIEQEETENAEDRE